MLRRMPATGHYRRKMRLAGLIRPPFDPDDFDLRVQDDQCCYWLFCVLLAAVFIAGAAAVMHYKPMVDKMDPHDFPWLYSFADWVHRRAWGESLDSNREAILKLRKRVPVGKKIEGVDNSGTTHVEETQTEGHAETASTGDASGSDGASLEDDLSSGATVPTESRHETVTGDEETETLSPPSPPSPSSATPLTSSQSPQSSGSSPSPTVPVSTSSISLEQRAITEGSEGTTESTNTIHVSSTTYQMNGGSGDQTARTSGEALSSSSPPSSPSSPISESTSPTMFLTSDARETSQSSTHASSSTSLKTTVTPTSTTPQPTTNTEAREGAGILWVDGRRVSVPKGRAKLNLEVANGSELIVQVFDGCQVILNRAPEIVGSFNQVIHDNRPNTSDSFHTVPMTDHSSISITVGICV